MGNIRIITGRSGCGKTNYCIDAFVSALTENRRADGSTDAYLIVPEQFAVDYERKVLNHPACRGLLGGEVLSFQRFAYRVLTDEAVRIPEMLSPSGKAMLLVRAVSECASELRYYKRCAENIKSIAGLLDTVNEFSKYCVTPEMLEKASAMSVNDDVLKNRLHELAVIYAKYGTFFSEEYSDSAIVYKKAAERIRNGTAFTSGAVIWIDSFSGFTELEMLLLKAIADGCKELNLCLFSDSDENLIFHCPNKTYHDVIRTLRSCGHTVNITDLQQKSRKEENRFAYTRFAGCEAIGFLEENFGRLHSGESGVSPDGIKLYRCTESYREIENCAKEIAKLAKSGMEYRDIAVVDADIDKNAALFSAVFSKMKIPFFIDAKRDLSGHPVVRFILSFLDIVAENMSLSSVLAMLKTGLYKPQTYTSDCVDMLENAALAAGVNSQAGWQRMCRRLSARFGDDMPQYGTLAFDIYTCIYGADGFAERMKQCTNINDCCRAVIDFANEAALADSVKHNVSTLSEGAQSALSETYARVWNVFAELTRQASVFLGSVKIRGYKKLITFFADALRAGFAVCKVGFIPHTAQCVQIGNADRSRYLDKKVVFVTGANDGAFPSGFSEGGVLGDAERELLQACGASLAYNSQERAYFAQYNVYSVLSSPSERLYVSFSAYAPDGEPKFPSPCISSLLRLFPALEVIPAETPRGEEADFSDSVQTDVWIDKKLAALLLKIGAECRMSVSRLEDYRACPYSFFLRQCLKLQDRDMGEVQRNNIGTYFHGLIEHAVRNSDFQSGELDHAAAERLIKTAASAFLEEEDSETLRDLFDNSAKSRLLRDRIEEFAVHDVKNIARIAAESGFLPVAEECAFGEMRGAVLPPVKIPCADTVVSLRGIIDRIDLRVKDGIGELCVVDHKSSSQDINEQAVNEGRKLQLFTYYLALENMIAAAKENEISIPDVFYTQAERNGLELPGQFVPAAVLYYVFGKNVEETKNHTYSGFSAPGVFTGIKKEDCSAKETDLANLSENAKENIRLIFDNISSGHFPVTPEKSVAPCRYCGCDSLCMYRKNGDFI